MNREEREIRKNLSKKGTHAYVTPDGKALYLPPFPNGKMIKIVGPDFHSLTDAQINKCIQDALQQVIDNN